MTPELPYIRAPSSPTFGQPAAALKRLWKMPDLPKPDLRQREWVYFLESQTPPHLLKIGHTRNLKWRLLGLQSQCPVALKLLNAIDCPAGTEWIIHALFKVDRQHGEWFAQTERLVEFMGKLPRGGRLTVKLLESLASGFDCRPYFVRALERKGKNGRRTSLLEPASLVEMKRMRQQAKREGDANAATVIAARMRMHRSRILIEP